MTKTERIAALIAKGTYKNEDKPWLEAMPDAAIEALSKGHEPVAAPPAPAPTPAPTAAAAAPAAIVQTMEQFLASAPAELREPLMAGHLANQARRTQLITSLKATGRNKFTDEQLASFTTDHLVNLADLAQVPTAQPAAPVNYALRGVAADPVQEAEPVPAPPSLVDAIRTAAGQPVLVHPSRA